jgi:prophage regulatory protein
MERRKNQVLRVEAVLDRLSISRSQLYRLIEAGVIPKPISLGARASGWIESEIDAAIARCAARRRGEVR